MLVGVHGFSCTGNLGDLAMAEAIARRLVGAGHGVTVFAFGDDCDDMNVLRYCGAEVVSRDKRYVARELDAFVLGGGDLGFGFGWELVAQAVLGGAKLISFGCGYKDEWLQQPQLSQQVLSRFAAHIVRDEPSVHVLEQLGVPCTLGADPAFACEAGGWPQLDGGVALFVRHPNREFPHAAQRDAAEAAVRAVRASNLSLHVFACSEEDARYCEVSLGLGRCRVPRRGGPALAMLSGASAVVTLGRYHPAVFACAGATACAGYGAKLEAVASQLGTRVLRRDCSDATAFLHSACNGLPARAAEARALCESGYAKLLEVLA